MTPEERYCFDVSGFIVLPGVLGQEALERARRGDLAFLADGAEHFAFVQELCGGKYPGRQVTRNPRQLVPHLLEPRQKLQGGYNPADISRRYASDNGQRCCNTLQLLWCLDGQPGTDLDDPCQDDYGRWVAFPSSHMSNIVAPDTIVGGSASPMRRRPALKPGDLLVAAGSLLCGLLPAGDPSSPAGRTQLVLCEYSGQWNPGAAFVADLPTERPVWQAGLGPAEVSLLNGTTEADAAPQPAVSRLVLTAAEEQAAADRWAWDLCGYIVIKNAMEDSWCDTCLDALAANQGRIIDRTHDRTFPRDHNGSAEHGARVLVELLALEPPHAAPFAKMVANPAVVDRAVWMLGGRACGDAILLGSSHDGRKRIQSDDCEHPIPSFKTGRARVNHEPAVLRARVNHWPAGTYGESDPPVPEIAFFVFDEGEGGDTLHGGAPGSNPFSAGTDRAAGYFCRDGFTCVDKINVAYQLQDSCVADGGVSPIFHAFVPRLRTTRDNTANTPTEDTAHNGPTG